MVAGFCCYPGFERFTGGRRTSALPNHHAATLPFRDVVRYAAGLASIGAGIIHLTAVSAHTEHPVVAAFFIASGVVQIAWGGWIASAGSRLLMVAGAVGNAAAVGVWIASRTTGLPWVEGAQVAEPIGVKDAAATLLEIAIVVGCVALLRMDGSRLLRLPMPRNAFAPLAAATVLIVFGGIVAPSHQHTNGHTKIAGVHLEHPQAAGHEPEHSPGHTDHPAAATHGAAHAKAMPGHASPTHGGHVASAPKPAAERPAPKVEGIAASVRYGPFYLPPKGLGGEAHVNRIVNNGAKPCTGCSIIEMKPNLVYDDGTNANLDTGAMLHHAVWTRPNIADATCGRDSVIGSQGQRFFASGNERTPFVVPDGFGYDVGSDPWTLIVEIMNHGSKGRNVFVTLDVKYRPASDGLKKVSPVWLDVDNCADSQYSVPAGKSYTGDTWTSSMTGRVVAAGGHVHDGGVKTVLSNATTRKDMCTSVAGYGKDPAYAGSIESMSFCSWDQLGIVRKGEVLALDAFYDSTEAQDDVMGIVLAMIYETNDLSGGTPANAPTPREPKPPPPHDH